MARVSLQGPIGSIEEKFLDDLLVHIEVIGVRRDSHDSYMERCLAANILCVDVGAKFNKQLYIHKFLLQDGKVKGCRLEIIALINIKFALFLQDEH